MHISLRRERRIHAFRQTFTCSLGDPCIALQTIVSSLKQCSTVRELDVGRKIHQHLTLLRYDTHLSVTNTLVNMYSKCGDIFSAREIFNLMEHKTAVTWNCLIFSYVERGENVKALELFENLECEPTLVTYVAALKACTGLANQKGMEGQRVLKSGMLIHEKIRRQGLGSDVRVAGSLVDMYCKCGDMRLARDLFDKMPRKNVITWTSLLFGYVANGESHTALKLYDEMDCEPDHVTFVAAVKACTSLAAENPLQRDLILEKGICIHEHSKKLSGSPGILLQSALVEMYSKCGKTNIGKEMFDKITRKDTVAWNCLMQGYVENGQSLLALNLFNHMDFTPDASSCVAALKACSSMAGEGESLNQNAIEAVHETIQKLGLESEPKVMSSLVDVYCKLGRVELARNIFDRTVRKDIVTWTCLILGYVNNGEYSAALDLFDGIDCEPDEVTYVAAFRACTGMARCTHSERQAALRKSMLVHESIKERRLESSVSVACALMKLYSSYGKIELSRDVFDRMTPVNKTVVVWTCIITGYVDNGKYNSALELYNAMDVQPDEITYIAALKACTGLGSDGLEIGRAIHQRLEEQSVNPLSGIGNTVVNMYRKCGGIGMAKEVFDRLSFKDVVTWTSLILGYLESGEFAKALTLFDRMDCKPDSHAYAVALKACGCLVELPHGKRIHAAVSRLGLELDAAIVNTLVELYGRCGCLGLAEEMFCCIDTPGILSWNALMTAYSVGECSQVLKLAGGMKDAGVELNSCTFLHVLVACSHGGEVEKGEAVFDYMKSVGVAPTVEHYTCMIDMLCRADKFEEANRVILNMPLEADGVAWTTLLAACRKWNNFNAAKLAFDEILYRGADGDVGAACVMMSDICRFN